MAEKSPLAEGVLPWMEGGLRWLQLREEGLYKRTALVLETLAIET